MPALGRTIAPKLVRGGGVAKSRLTNPVPTVRLRA
jgi:hypothetical protein